MDTKKFTGEEGRLISAEQALKYTEPYQMKEREILGRGENFVKAEFFGIHTFNRLIGLHGDRCVGFRVYYGVAQEVDNDDRRRDIAQERDGRKETPRLFIVPVDEDGNDLTESARLGGMKDMPAREEVMRGGPLCPSHC